MSTLSVSLQLPFAVGDDGFPDVHWLIRQGLFSIGVVADLEESVVDALFRTVCGPDRELQVHFFDDNCKSVGRFVSYCQGASRHLEEFSIFNVCFSSVDLTRHAFISGDAKWAVCIGDGIFVGQCARLFPEDLESLAKRTADENLYSNAARAAAVNFVRHYMRVS